MTSWVRYVCRCGYVYEVPRWRVSDQTLEPPLCGLCGESLMTEEKTEERDGSGVQGSAG